MLFRAKPLTRSCAPLPGGGRAASDLDRFTGPLQRFRAKQHPMAVGALVRVTDVSCVLVVFGRVALARMVSASLVQVKGPGNQGYINWVRPGDCGKGCSAHVPLARRRGAGALTTNWAGNFRRALGCVDTAVYFRNKLR